MQPPIFAANWKMHHGPTEAAAYVDQFLKAYTQRDNRTVLLFPPALSVGVVRQALDRAGRDDIGLGVQNIWTEDKGAFTGENSAPMARDAGAGYVLVGHSERRHVFGETGNEVAKKVRAALRHDLKAILCVGEKLEDREAGNTNTVVEAQLRTALAGLPREAAGRLAVAYEPVWAIGTGRNATPADAAAVHAVLRGVLTELFAGHGTVPILYGGSVNANNAGDLLAAPGVDGLLVGGASLDAEGWARICATDARPK